MHIVAINALAGPIEQEAAALAADLGTATYDERLNLNAGFPSVVLATADGERARALAAKIRARGHDTLLCTGALVVPGNSMVSLRRFRLDAHEVVADDRPEHRLPHDQIAVLVRATHSRQTTSHSTVKEKSFSLGRAIVTGGMIFSKTVKRDVTTTREDTEEVLYVFRHDRATPWILRENETHYVALGGEMTISTRANFLTTIARFKDYAPHAAVDDRLLAFRRVPERANRAGALVPSLAPSAARGVDLLAHLIALSHQR